MYLNNILCTVIIYWLISTTIIRKSVATKHVAAGKHLVQAKPFVYALQSQNGQVDNNCKIFT